MIAVIIPCYRVRERVLDVLAEIGKEVDRIYVVDDACPERSGRWVEDRTRDPRVQVLYHETNQWVGAATLTGYRRAIADGADVLVKLDGDGQMDPALIPRLVQPILAGEADYTKGNRFYDLDHVRSMPTVRLMGNAALSFVTKASSGYWDVFDPNNGFTALHARVAQLLPLDKIARRWFFESDLLFRLNTVRAVVRDVPMTARYGDEPSNLVVSRVIGSFAGRNLVNVGKRILYNYFLRSFGVASIELVSGVLLLGFGVWIGWVRWLESQASGLPATAATVMLSALPIVLGTQLLLAFLAEDVRDVPRDPIHRRLN